jgi:DNA invertase Pin-like site-specific DNA recombinase
MKAGNYLRVSTDKQSEENQEPECRKLCEARGWEPVFYREVMSGAKQRPIWDRLKEDVRKGNITHVVFWSIDRIGRNKVQVCHDLRELFRFGATVASVKESWLDHADGPLRGLLIDIIAWFAEGERARLIERTKAGLVRARALGRKLGRRPLPKEQQDAIRACWGRGEGAYWAAKQLGLKESTCRAYMKRFEEEKKCAEKGPKNEG